MTPLPNGVTHAGMVVICVAAGVSHVAAGAMHGGTGVMQFAMAAAGVASVVSHCAPLCTRIPAGVTAAGSAPLHGRNAVVHGPAVERCVSYVVGDSVVAVCVDETGVTRFRLVVPRVVIVVVLRALFVSRAASGAFDLGPEGEEA